MTTDEGVSGNPVKATKIPDEEGAWARRKSTECLDFLSVRLEGNNMYRGRPKRINIFVFLTLPIHPFNLNFSQHARDTVDLRYT